MERYNFTSTISWFGFFLLTLFVEIFFARAWEMFRFIFNILQNLIKFDTKLSLNITLKLLSK